MKIYMLDTDTVSLALRGVGNVEKRILGHKPSRLCISSITLAELRFGLEKKRSPQLERVVTAFVRGIHVAPFDAKAAFHFGKVATSLIGTPIGEFDALLAAHAIALDATLVTNNTRHFQRVPGLEIETWG
jgi:tRNA(fMet)-specific endonuclease VapC